MDNDYRPMTKDECIDHLVAVVLVCVLGLVWLLVP